MLNDRGIGLLYCGKWNKKDEDKIRNSLNILRGSLKEIKSTKLPKNRGERNIIFIKPEQGCPNTYPRAIGKPSKYPL